MIILKTSVSQKKSDRTDFLKYEHLRRTQKNKYIFKIIPVRTNPVISPSSYTKLVRLIK